MYEGFQEIGGWPSTAYVDAVLDHDYEEDFNAALADLPPALLTADSGYTSHSTVRATVAGLSVVEAASDDLQLFVDLVRFAAERERTFRPSPVPDALEPPTVSGAEAHAIWGRAVSDHELARVIELVRTEGLGVMITVPHEGHWSVGVDRLLRRYRGVRDVAEYVRRRPEPFTPRSVLVRPADPYVFVLMPFGESWSSNVKDTITQACEHVARSVPSLRWERADDMTATGKITDQIMAAIDRADVLIADITHQNSNVMFELGYADALGRPIIVLNQDVDDTPFDIKDWRQIPYSADDIGAARGALVDFLTGALRVARVDSVATVTPT